MVDRVFLPWAMVVDIHRSHIAALVAVPLIRTNTDIEIEIMVTCHLVVVVVESAEGGGEIVETRTIVNLADVVPVVKDFTIRTV